MKSALLSRIFLISAAALVLVACSAGAQTPAPAPPAPSSAPNVPDAPVSTPTQPKILPPATSTPLIPTQETPQLELCTPLEGYRFDQLTAGIVNPFLPPAAGSDDAHQGVDIADLLPNSRVAVAGRPVFAILSGDVAGVVRDRFPYGNAVLIETPLNALPPTWSERMIDPHWSASFTPNTVLTCPQSPEQPEWMSNPARSLYILYAHLQNPVGMERGAAADCGQQLGEIGNTGNALNPHLHIEIRIGPSGAQFDSMAHYDATASAAEMEAYCVWRVSGQFVLVDPLKLFEVGWE